MLVGRRRKIAIVAAILIAGTGIALVFRREESHEALSTADGPPSTARSTATSPSTHSPSPEPRFAGHIEPTAPLLKNPLESTSVEPGAPGKSTLEPFPSTPRAERWDGNPGNASARFAADIPESPLKWQTVRRPAAAASERDLERDAAGALGARARWAEKRHRIVDGDTLAALAHRYLGVEHRQMELFEYNRDILTNPELLPIGQELRIPPANFVRPATPSSGSQGSPRVAVSQDVERPSPTLMPPSLSPPPTFAPRELEVQTYVVQPHDTLALIARRFYGDISRQRELLAANRQQLGSAKDLRPGMKLVVPAAKTAR